MGDPWELAVKKLNLLTESGTLKWRKATAYTASSGVVGIAYTTFTSGKNIVIFEERGDGSGFYPDDSHVVIEFVDEKWQPEWRWPGISESWRLLEAVKFQVAAGHDFLQNLLSQ